MQRMSIIENKDIHMDNWQQTESQIMTKYHTTTKMGTNWGYEEGSSWWCYA